MKLLPVILLVFFINISAAMVPLEDIREAYKVCNTSKENANRLFNLTEKGLKKGGAIFKGYYGAALTLKASFGWNPITKMSYFNKGKKIIEDAIQEEPENIELRLIRLSIQSNIPKILGYSKNIEEDRNFILLNVKKVMVSSLKNYIQGFIENSGAF